MNARTKQLMTSVPLLVVGVLAIGFVLYSIAKEHKRTAKIDQEIAKQEEMAAEIAGENDLLRKTIAYLESEEAQKFNAQQLGYQSEDQNVARVRDVSELEARIEEQIASEKNKTQLPQREKQAHWQVWWQTFF